MKHILAVALFLAATATSAREVSVLLLNAGTTDVSVEEANKSAVAELLPGSAAEVKLVQPQWLKLGQEVYRFDVGPIFRLPGTKVPPVIQVGVDGKLYLMPAGTTQVGAKPPPQPRGFPIKSSKKLDLT